MKKTIVFFALISLLLAACSAGGEQVEKSTTGSLLVSGGSSPKTYTAGDLEKLPAAQAAFKDVQYKGVPVFTLLEDAGFDPQTVKAVKAMASDGFSVNYDPSQFMAEDFLVAFARADGPLSDEDGSFRIVMPASEGKLNVRMLVELQVIQ